MATSTLALRGSAIYVNFSGNEIWKYYGKTLHQYQVHNEFLLRKLLLFHLIKQKKRKHIQQERIEVEFLLNFFVLILCETFLSHVFRLHFVQIMLHQPHQISIFQAYSFLQLCIHQWKCILLLIHWIARPSLHLLVIYRFVRVNLLPVTMY